jgi:ERAP1-like C-terminal domain
MTDICGMLRHHSLLQREILEASVYFGLSSAVSEARRLFQQWMAGNLQLPADIRDIVYSTGKDGGIYSQRSIKLIGGSFLRWKGIKYGGWTEWDYCWQRYKETNLPEERLNYLRSLAASNDPWILQQ